MAAVLAGLGFYLYFIELPAKRSEEVRETQNKRLLSFDEQQITKLSVNTSGSEVVLTQADNHTWQITSPIQTEADKRQVQSMIRALITGKVARVVEETPSSLAPFGLDAPATIVTIAAGQQEERISIGDAGPLSSTLYVLRGSDQKVLLTDLASKDFLNKNLMAFRRKEVLQFTHNDVERLRLTYPQTEIVLYSQDQKPKKRWRIRFPIEAEADQTAVQGLLFRLEDLKALAIIDPGPERAAKTTLLAKPKVKVSIHAGGADQTVKIYQPDPASGEAFAETIPDGPLYKVSPTTIKDLTKDLFALQDKRLLGAETAQIALLSVKTRDQQYVLIHQNDEWLLEDRPMEKISQEHADLFVSRVVNLPAEERVLKHAGALTPYGLAAPAAEFVATGKDGAIVGKLSLGSQVGGLVYAMGQRLSGVFQARADLLTQIPTTDSLLHPDSTTVKRQP